MRMPGPFSPTVEAKWPGFEIEHTPPPPSPLLALTIYVQYNVGVDFDNHRYDKYDE